MQNEVYIPSNVKYVTIGEWIDANWLQLTNTEQAILMALYQNKDVSNTSPGSQA
jgi:hypothetical protein